MPASHPSASTSPLNVIRRRIKTYTRGRNRTVIFIGSTMRSGSTLLKALLAEAPDVSHFSEQTLLDYYGREWEVYDIAPQRVLVFKYPSPVDTNAPFQGRLNVPNLRHIFLVRHPHDVCQSLYKRPPWQDRPLADTVDYWTQANAKLMREMPLDAKTVYFIRYEDLLADPIAKTAEMYRFIGSARTEGTETYGETEEGKWEWGKDDGGDVIKSKRVQPRRNKRHDELIEIIRNHEQCTALLSKLGYPPLDDWLAEHTD